MPMIKNTDDIFPETSTVPHPEPEATHVVDVHIFYIREDDEETRSIETTLEQIRKENQPPDEPMMPVRPTRTLSPLVFLCIGILLLALLGQVYLSLVALLMPTTTITIIPVSKQVQARQPITVVPGPISGQDQIAGRLLSPLTISQNQTVPTTGTAHQDATAATGTITFYNAAPYAQTIPLGLLLVGKSGMHYTTDQEAEIPAAVYPAFGHTTVGAHALTIGPNGNQPADDLYGPCCLLNISAVSNAFTGGQNERDYQTVSEQDINGTANTLKTKLAGSAQTVLQTQVQNGEALITPLACTSQVTSNHQPGEEAAQVTITINETCTTLAYKTAAIHEILAHAVTLQAAKLGAGYIPTSDLDTTITAVHMSEQGTATMQIAGTQTYGYQFSQVQQLQLKDRIAGKGRDQATTVLLHTPGVQTVSIHFDADVTTLPTDTSRIHILFLIE